MYILTFLLTSKILASIFQHDMQITHFRIGVQKYDILYLSCLLSLFADLVYSSYTEIEFQLAS